MLLSAATALHVGSTSYSKAYVGNTQVWPSTGYKLEYVEYYSGLTSGDSYVLIAENTKNILSFKDQSGPQGESHLFTNSVFSAFTGTALYQQIPEYSAIFQKNDTNTVIMHKDYYDGDQISRCILSKIAGTYKEDYYRYIVKYSDRGTSWTAGFITLSDYTYRDSKGVGIGLSNGNVLPLCYCPSVYFDPVLLSTRGVSSVEKDFYNVYKIANLN